MKRLLLIIIIAVISGLIYFLVPRREEPVEIIVTRQNITMKITSSAFAHNGLIPKQYTCDGENFNPPLKISGTPSNAKSLALIVDDPDAPGRTWIHWTLWNIDPKTIVIAENNIPVGALEGVTDFGKPGYGGPCPPPNPDPSVGAGTHRYFFKIYALDTLLNLPASAKKSDIEAAMQGHILDQAELIGLYRRS